MVAAEKIENHQPETNRKNTPEPRKLIGLGFYVCLGALCLSNRDKLTLDAIISYTPEDPALAVAVMLALFTLKGSTAVINGGMLYAACGIMFPLPTALVVGAAGTAIMTTIPFFVGRNAVAETMDTMAQKYKKLELIMDAPRHNEMLFTFLVRFLGILPCEPMGMYLGACGLHYGRYMAGTMLGIAPAITAYSMMGEYVSDPLSPRFIAAICIQAGTTLCTPIIIFVKKRKVRKNQENGME